MRIFKKICGIFCLIEVIVGLGILFSGKFKEHIFIGIFECALFGIMSFLFLKPTHKKDSQHEQNSYQLEAPTETQTSTAVGDLVTIQTEYTPSKVPDDIAKEMRKCYTLMQAQRDAEIMAESYRLASTTTNLDTFCMRYDLAMQKAHTLLQAEQVGVRGIKKLNCHNACVSVIESATSLKLRALHDYAKSEFYAIDVMKTNKGKCNRYIKMLITLERAEPTFMFMDEYNTLIDDVKVRINELGATVSEQK